MNAWVGLQVLPFAREHRGLLESATRPGKFEFLAIHQTIVQARDQRFDLINDTRASSAVRIARRSQVRQKQRVRGGDDSIEMTHAGFVVADKVEVVGGGQVDENNRVFFIGQAGLGPFAVEANEDAVVEWLGKCARSKGDVVWSFAFRTIRGIGQREECDQWLNARSTDNRAGA